MHRRGAMTILSYMDQNMVSILYWRCPHFAVSPVTNAYMVFQFSIGDAEEIIATITPYRKRVKFQFSIGDEKQMQIEPVAVRKPSRLFQFSIGDARKT